MYLVLYILILRLILRLRLQMVKETLKIQKIAVEKEIRSIESS